MSLLWTVKESKKSHVQRRRHEREVEAKQAEQFVANVVSGFEPPPFELPAEELEQRFCVPATCLGLVIGKKGEHLKSVEKKFKVSIKLETDDKSGEGLVIISGESSKSVSAARKELDFDYKSVEVTAEEASWLKRKAMTLKLIRDMTGVTLLTLRSETNSTPGDATPGHSYVEIKGLRSEVEAAALCLDAHMSYYSVFAEMEQVEKALDERIAAAKLQTAGRQVGVPSRSQSRRRSKSRSEGRTTSAARRLEPPRAGYAAAPAGGRTRSESPGAKGSKGGRKSKSELGQATAGKSSIGAPSRWRGRGRGTGAGSGE